ncbi:hypothetical protein EIP86_006857 [Pleurotus ostreatoroseus]|nr:hypothetical protein EIP86_006857 [Pleurotus ostreatoroseus]
MATPSMPGRKEKQAPTFEADQPRELKRYFEDLELLLDRCKIADDRKRKDYARLYVPIAVSDIWENLPEYIDATSYDDFKKRILKLYPGSEDDRRYSRADLLELVLRTSQTGVGTLDSWAAFYREYLTVSNYLIKEKKFSADEQGRRIFGVLGDALQEATLRRLQIKKPDHEADAAYELKDIDEAVTYNLRGGGLAGATATGTTHLTPAANSATPQAGASAAAPQVGIKTEDFSALVESFSKLAQILPRNQVYGGNPGGGGGGGNGGGPRSMQDWGSAICHYCGGQGHGINRCQYVEEDIRAGKARRNFEGKVVLNTGAFVPNAISGSCLRERIEKWHIANPGQTSKGQLSYGVDSMLYELGEQDTAAGFQLNAAERIESLERELYVLRNGKMRFDGVHVPRPPPRKPMPTNTNLAPHPDPPQPADNLPSTVAPGDGYTTLPKRPADAMMEPHTDNGPTNHHGPAHFHPFSGARDATSNPAIQKGGPFDYAKDNAVVPPVGREYGHPPAKPFAGGAARNKAPVESDRVCEAVFNRFFQRGAVMVTMEEACALSSDFRNRTRFAVTPKRTEGQGQAGATGASSKPAVPGTRAVMEQSVEQEGYIPSPAELREQPDQAGVFVLPKTYEAYLQDDDIGRNPIKVAAESKPLRVVHALIDHRERVECILDPGCQIVAMAERIAVRLGLAWDPSVTLTMQSANGATD